MLVVGLTGGVATGKSSVSARLKELGAHVIDADLIAREVVRPGRPALEEIRASFGEEVVGPDGTLDRKMLGDIVFRDAGRRRELEAIVHPRIRDEMKASLASLRKTEGVRVAVLDIPLLFESQGSRVLVERVLVVYATPEQQERRLIERNGLPLEEARRRIAAQMPIDEKVRLADDVIDNTGTWEETVAQVDRLWKEWTGACASH